VRDSRRAKPRNDCTPNDLVRCSDESCARAFRAWQRVIDWPSVHLPPSCEVVDGENRPHPLVRPLCKLAEWRTQCAVARFRPDPSFAAERAGQDRPVFVLRHDSHVEGVISPPFARTAPAPGNGAPLHAVAIRVP
jgi:hypothetical protein